jgi:hypothetical protein
MSQTGVERLECGKLRSPTSPIRRRASSMALAPGRPARQPGVNQYYAVLDGDRIGVHYPMEISMTPSTTSRMPSSSPYGRADRRWPSKGRTPHTGDRVPNSLRTNGATSVPKSSIERIVRA